MAEGRGVEAVRNDERSRLAIANGAVKIACLVGVVDDSIDIGGEDPAQGAQETVGPWIFADVDIGAEDAPEQPCVTASDESESQSSEDVGVVHPALNDRGSTLTKQGRQPQQ